MNKLVSVTARLTASSVQYIEHLSKIINVDKSTAFRALLQKGIEADRKEKAVELYFKGKLTLEGAAHFADTYIGEFLELLKEKGIENNITPEDFKKSIEHGEKLVHQ
jgi:predicted HTH domain antitoxin